MSARPTRTVVDSNYLQREELRNYLAASTGNYVVLCDYAAMEAYKGDTLVSIMQSMSVLRHFPWQVIVLKDTGAICLLTERTSAPEQRMIDESQTKGFAEFSLGLNLAERGHRRALEALLDHGRKASARMDELLANAARTAKSIPDLKTYTDNELRMWRKGSEISDGLFDKIGNNVLWLTAETFRLFKVPKLPKYQEVLDTYLFRAALCFHVWNLELASGPPMTNTVRVRNDMIDSNFAAYATFFDGLLSADKRANSIYANAMKILIRLRG